MAPVKSKTRKVKGWTEYPDTITFRLQENTKEPLHDAIREEKKNRGISSTSNLIEILLLECLGLKNK